MVVGIMIGGKDMEFINGLTVRGTKVNGSKAREKVKEPKNFLMVRGTRAIGSIINATEKAFICSQTGIRTKDNGNMTKDKAMASYITETEISMKVNGLKTRNPG
jgi:hypothetical protein